MMVLPQKYKKKPQPEAVAHFNVKAYNLIHQSAFTPSILRIGLLEVAVGVLHITAAAGGEHVEGLAAEVVGLDEGVDDGGGGVPPHGETDPHGVVLGNVLAAALDGGTRALVLHLNG